MGLYVIGLGLGDEKDITVRGLEIIKRCSAVYLEYYTSVLGVDSKKLVSLLLSFLFTCLIPFRKLFMVFQLF